MSIEFYSETKINGNFINEVTEQLIESEKDSRPLEEREILREIIKDLRSKSDNRPFDKDSGRFTLLPNEYNYLTQNEKSLWADYLIFRYKFRVYPVLKRLTDFPIHLLVEPVSYCNLKCPMCFQADKTFTKKPYMGHMDMELFKDVIDQAVQEGNRALTMASRGEPTLHPQFGEILEYAKGKFFDFKINTNAMLLDEEKCRQILDNGVTELVFSIESTEKGEYERIRRLGRFEEVLGNIKRFHEIRHAEYPKSKCRTRVSAVRYTESFDIEHFAEFWGQIVDNVACVTMQTRWDSYNNKPSDKIFPCPLLWERLYIWFDGTANPCDYDYKSFLKVGNVRGKRIKDIWKGKEFTTLREDHMKGMRKCHIPCDRCEY